MNHKNARPGFTVSNPLSRNRSRRSFLRNAAGLTAGLGLGGYAATSLADGHKNRLPKPDRSGIEHIVVVMMENRSFDHFLGWLPRADGRQAGLVYRDSAGVAHSTHALAPDYQGCAHPGPDHSYQGGRIEYNNGRCDGWLRAGANDEYAIGYYIAADLPFLSNAATSWTTFDRYFAAILAGTFPNRFYQHAAQTDRLDNSVLPLSSLPTIWDRLADRGVSGKYYYSDFPFLALWGAKYLGIANLISTFFSDAAAGTLPAVSFVDPRFIGEEEGLSNDDHPHADIRNGEVFLNDVYNAVTNSPNWPNTVMVINFDEWGGFFDHVRPPMAPIPPADAALGSDGRRGFRVPCLVVSPFAQRGEIASDLYDHTSVLNMIEWRWNLQPLTVRDRTANNLAEALDFRRPDLKAPAFNVPPGPFGTLCSPLTAEEIEFPLAYAAQFGFAAPE